MHPADPDDGEAARGRGARLRDHIGIALGVLLSVALCLVVHEAGLRQVERRQGARAAQAVERMERALHSATLAIETLSRLPEAGQPDLGPLTWYQASRDHLGLLAAARLAEGATSRLRLLSPQTPIWMNRVLLQVDDLFVGRAALGLGPEIQTVAPPPEAAAGHRFYRIAVGPPGQAPMPAAPGAPAAAMPPVTLVLVDATALLEGAAREAGLAPERLRIADESGAIYGGGGAGLAAAPFARALHFAGAEWTLHYALPARWASGWDLLAAAILLGGLAGTFRLAARPPRRDSAGGARAAERENGSRQAAPATAVPPESPPAGMGHAEPDSPAANAGLPDGPVEGFLEFEVQSGRLLRANDAAGRLLGYRDGRGLEVAVSEARRLFADTGQYQALLDTLRRTGGVGDFDADLLRRDKTRLPAALGAWPASAGAPMTRIAVTLRDASARREAERALILERDAAEARSRAKSEFIANMSHELRTPLNAILGFSEIMTAQMFGPIGSDRYRQYAEDIHASGRHLLGIVNDVLDLSKIEASRFELHEEALDLAHIAQEVGRLVEARAAEGGVRLRLDVPGDLQRVRADSRLVRQMLLNLLSNAVKFTLPGGEVAVLGYLDPADGLVLAVRDTGIGMRAEDIPRALEPFGQIPGSGAKPAEGTGLGLPLAKSIAEAHGGSLSIESAQGAGTTVIVRFPANRVVRA